MHRGCGFRRIRGAERIVPTCLGHSDDASLALALAWPDFIYGLVDALLLSVMPVLAAGIALKPIDLGGTSRSRVAVGAAAVAASAVVTAAYHLAYPEFRGAAVAGPLLGNMWLALSYVLTRSPLAPSTGHIAMHDDAVLHGMETTIQLPPH